MNKVVMSNVRDPENRSKRKYCVCGGHNWKNFKKNKHHHSTQNRLLIRHKRQQKEQFYTWFLNLLREVREGRE